MTPGILPRSARLVHGTTSTENHITGRDKGNAGERATEPGGERDEVVELINEVRSMSLQYNNPYPDPLMNPDRWLGGRLEDTHVVERPAWQAFVLSIQLHNLDWATELDAAHQLGMLNHPRVSITQEGIDTLNYFINKWYGKEVEIVTTRVARQVDGVDVGNEGARFEYPFRPVTGLRVIVTNTYQWDSDPYSKAVLQEREGWGWSKGVAALDQARKLYVQNRVPGSVKTSPTHQVRKGSVRGWIRTSVKRKLSQ